MGLSILDNLDTLWLMGLDEEYARARSFVHLNLSFAIDAEVNTFETTIRALAGLLSAYALTEDTLFLTRARDLGKVRARARPIAAAASPQAQSSWTIQSRLPAL